MRHVVQLYRGEDFLLQALESFADAGLRKGETVLIIATGPHLSACTSALAAKGHNLAAAAGSGQWHAYNAEILLPQIMSGDMPDAKAFDALVGAAIRQAIGFRKKRKMRAFGELVNLLSENDNLKGAEALEDLWNELVPRYRFSLYCAYAMDALDPKRYHGAVQQVCRTHSHFVTDLDNGQFDNHLGQALREILGSELSLMVRRMAVSERNFTVRMTEAEAVKHWLFKNMPLTADKILNAARHHLEAPTGAPALTRLKPMLA
ncbi:MAG TPA: MEDS domain-containing protein [Verrucomicrobiae bacterium]|nr:MEDS domain-containing protein [Verrucomicrobiae bacterium]